MHTWARFLLAVVLGFSASPQFAHAQTTQPTGKPATTEDADPKAFARSEIQKETAGLPSLGQRDLSQVLTFTLLNGKILPATSLPVSIGTSYAFKINGFPGTATIQVGVAARTTFDPRGLMQFSYRDPTQPDAALVRTDVYCNPEFVHISQERELTIDLPWSVQMVQTAGVGPSAFTLYIQTPSPDGQSLTPARRLTAGSLAELTREHPVEIDAYVRPIFRLFKQEQVVFRPDPKTAFQVLADLWQPDSATIAATDKAVAALAADSYTDRENAVAQLRSIGQPAALWLMRQTSRGLTPDQAMHLDLFLTPYRPLDDAEALRLKSQPDFLLDCLYSSDAVLQKLALEQLGFLTHKEIAMPSDPIDGVFRFRQLFTAKTTQP